MKCKSFSSFPCTKRLVLLLAFVPFSNAFGQTPGMWEVWGPWERAPIIISFLADPTDPNTIYAGTRHNGVYKSTDQGLTWTHNAPISPSPQHVANIFWAKGIRYTGERNVGAFYSVDGGINWTLANPPLRDKNISVFFTVEGIIYARTSDYSGTSTGVFYSVDGINWALTNPPLDNLTCMLSIDGVIWAGTGNGLFYSRDKGTNWIRANPPVDSGSVLTLISLDSTLVVVIRNKIFRTIDGGSNWTSPNRAINDSVVTTLLLVDNALFARGDRHVFRSTDGGVNWTQAVAPAGMPEGGFIVSNGTIYGRFGFSVDGGMHWQSFNELPLQAPITKYAMLVVEDRVYLSALVSSATTDEGEGALFLSTDKGRNWSRLNQGLGRLASIKNIIVDFKFMVAYHDFSLFQSTDRGMNWIEPNPNFLKNEVRFIKTMALLDGALYLTSETRQILYKSIDGAINWSAISNGTYVFAAKGKLFVSRTSPSELYWSADGGLSWTEANGPVFNTIMLAIFSTDKILFAQTSGGVFFSLDDGVNWNNVGPPLADKSLASMLSMGKIILAGTNAGLFISRDGGFSWSQAKAPMNDKSVTSLISLEGTIYAGTNGGIFSSKDGGINWIQANSLITGKMITIGGRIYTLTSNGVFWSRNGSNWFPLNTGMREIPLNLAALPILDRLYAATANGVYFQTLDYTPPVAASISINGNAAFTKQRIVQLTLAANAADSMSLAQDPNFSNFVWKVYQVNSSFTLTPGDGSKTIYVRFADISYNISDTLQASITLDETLPTMPDSLASQLVLGQPNKRSLTWIKSTDATSGLDRYRIQLSQASDFSGATTTRDSVFASDNPSYTTPILPDAKWYWRVTAIDRAGNERVSPADSFVVNVGQAPAAPSIQLTAPITSNNTPTISWTQVDGAESYRLQYAVSANFANATTISDLTVPSYTFTQALPDGLFFFCVYAKNASGIESVASSVVQMSIDTRPPQNPVMQIATGSAFTKIANVLLRLSATEADSVRVLGDLANTDLVRLWRR